MSPLLVKPSGSLTNKREIRLEYDKYDDDDGGDEDDDDDDGGGHWWWW